MAKLLRVVELVASQKGGYSKLGAKSKDNVGIV
jgi:hypothetical protein